MRAGNTPDELEDSQLGFGAVVDDLLDLLSLFRLLNGTFFTSSLIQLTPSTNKHKKLSIDKKEWQ